MVSLQVDRWLQERRPAPDLTAVLRCVWRGDLRDFRTPLPDECLDLTWIDDGTLWLSGPESRSWSPEEPTGVTAVGVRFQPGVGPAALGLAASEVRDARVRMDEVWGDRAAREMAERLALQTDDRGRTRELERAVRRLAVDARPVDEVGRQVAAGIGGTQPLPVRQLARSTGLSERQLLRRCTAAFGYGPARLARILRLQRTLYQARSSPRPARLVDLATAAGYVDQQHLAHEAQAIMGTTPTVLLRASDVRSVQDRPRAQRE
jgi:AraC-like DNA-binding protein